MAISINLNTKQFDKGLKALDAKVKSQNRKAIREISGEILRLSAFEVPHDKGMLQNSGTYELKLDSALVGYNKVYAARLHEHPEYHFQKGRKGKYLEDPIKNNLNVFRKFYAEVIGQVI